MASPRRELSEPLPVSVIIPAYNRAGFLPLAVASVRAQTRAPAEIIVVDDGSSDETAAVARGLGVHVLSHERNRGLPAARNTAIKAASQPWIAQLDSDDEWLPHLLETLWASRDRHAFVAGSAVIVGDRPVRGGVWFHGNPGRRPRELSSPRDALLPYNPISASAVMFQATAADEIGGYTEDLRMFEDWDFWLRMLEVGTGVLVPDIVARYVLHGEQMSLDAAVAGETLPAIIASGERAGWLGTRERLRLEGALAWDRARAAHRQGDTRRAATDLLHLVSRPTRIRGALELLIIRQRIRRRVSRISTRGLVPSTAEEAGSLG